MNLSLDSPLRERKSGDLNQGSSTFLRAIPVFLLCLSLFSCQKKAPRFQLNIELNNTQPGSIYLYRLFSGQAPVLVDSFRCTQLDEHFELSDEAPLGEAIYQLSIPNVRTNLYFISDVQTLEAKINAVNPRAYTTNGSRGSIALQNLQQAQNPWQDSLTIVSNKITNHIGDEGQLRRAAISMRHTLNENYFHFADTTNHPLAALFTAQQIDFELDRSRHKQFVVRLKKRFPTHPEILDFFQKTTNYLALGEVEYQIGDVLPVAVFTGFYGQKLDPAQWAGHDYLLEFWSSYCAPCLARLHQEKAVYQKYHPKGFNLIAFSLDEDPGMLQSVMSTNHYPWPIVADLKGWSGQGVNTYKIDSIPFNILVGADGRVKLKNIGARQLDSVLMALNKF